MCIEKYLGMVMKFYFLNIPMLAFKTGSDSLLTHSSAFITQYIWR